MEYKPYFGQPVPEKKQGEPKTYRLSIRGLRSGQQQQNKDLLDFLKDIDVDLEAPKDYEQIVEVTEEAILKSDIYISKRRLTYLANLGASVNKTDDKGQTILNIAIKSVKKVKLEKVLEMMEFIIKELKVQINIRTKKGVTPVMLCVNKLQKDPDFKMLQKLLDNKCDLSSVDSDGMNLLMLFVLKLKDFNDPRAYQYIKAFIQSGQVKVNHLTKRKQNVLHQIILKSVEVKSSLVNVIQILSFIISKGLNINQ